jgi:hypothetical protein
MSLVADYGSSDSETEEPENISQNNNTAISKSAKPLDEDEEELKRIRI